MKLLARLTRTVIVSILALAMLAGCGTAKPIATPTVQPTTATTTAAPSASAPEATAPTPSADSWTKDNSPLTVDWYVASSDYNSSWDPGVAYAAKKFKEITGVTINFSFPVGGDEDDKLNTMISSDSLTDLLLVGQNSPQYAMMEQSHMLQPLNQLMDQYAPGFKTLLTKSMVAWCTYTDGNLYGIPNYFFSKEELANDAKIDTGTGMIARKEIMDQLGITADDFKTQDGMIKALEKVRDAHILYNGKKVTPLYVGYNVEDDVYWNISQMFDISPEGPDGAYTNVYRNPRYLEMLQFLSKCYNDNLMDRENFTGTYDTEAEKLTSGQIFCIAGALGDFYGAFDLSKADKSVSWVGVGPVGPADGSPVHLMTQSMTGWLETCISAKTAKPDRLIRLLNFIDSEQGRFLTTVGVEGETFTLANGKAVLKPDVQAEFDKDSAAAGAKWGFSGNTNNPGVMWSMYDPVWGMKYSPVPTSPTDIMWRKVNDYFNPDLVPLAPFEACNPNAGTPEADTLAQVNNLYKSEVDKAILSKTPDEVAASWNAFLAKIDSMGYDKVVKAMDVKFQAHKKALGIDFAWPMNKK